MKRWRNFVQRVLKGHGASLRKEIFEKRNKRCFQVKIRLVLFRNKNKKFNCFSYLFKATLTTTETATLRLMFASIAYKNFKMQNF